MVVRSHTQSSQRSVQKLVGHMSYCSAHSTCSHPDASGSWKTPVNCCCKTVALQDPLNSKRKSPSEVVCEERPQPILKQKIRDGRAGPHLKRARAPHPIYCNQLSWWQVEPGKTSWARLEATKVRSPYLPWIPELLNQAVTCSWDSVSNQIKQAITALKIHLPERKLRKSSNETQATDCSFVQQTETMTANKKNFQVSVVQQASLQPTWTQCTKI